MVLRTLPVGGGSKPLVVARIGSRVRGAVAETGDEEAVTR